MILIYHIISKGELFDAPTRKKEATENLHIPKFLETEVGAMICSLHNDKQIASMSFISFCWQACLF